MSLAKRLQAENALSPASRAFSEDAWLDFCLEYLDYSDDDDVYIIGRLIHGALGALRQFVRFSNATSISPYSRRRLIVGVVNHQSTAARLLGKDAVDAIMRTAPGASLEHLADTRIDLPMGSFGLDAIVEAAVDAGARLMRDIPIDSSRLSSDASGVDVRALITDLRVAISYIGVERLWNDVVWNEYRLISEDGTNTFRPRNWAREIDRAICTYRHTVTSGFRNATRELRAKHRIDADPSSAACRLPQICVDVVDGRAHPKLASASTATQAAREAFRLETLPPYYESFLASSDQPTETLSLALIADGYCLLIDLASALAERATSVLAPKPDQPFSYELLCSLAPRINRAELRSVLAEALSILPTLAGELITFLCDPGFRAPHSVDLWAEPIVPLNDEEVVLIHDAPVFASTRRLTDLWLKKLGINIGQRGTAFERHVRQTLRKRCEGSPLNKLAYVHDAEFAFQAQDGEEKVDLIAVIGSKLVIGEIKCFVQPRDEVSQRRHWNEVQEAVDQLRRTINLIEQGEQSFRAKARRACIPLPDTYSVVPVVLLEHAVDAGCEVNGVPVVDLAMTLAFFDGYLLRDAELTRDGRVVRAKVERFYEDAKAAPDAVEAYFRNPPQLRDLRDAVEVRWDRMILPGCGDGRVTVGRAQVVASRVTRAAPLAASIDV